MGDGQSIWLYCNLYDRIVSLITRQIARRNQAWSRIRMMCTIERSCRRSNRRLRPRTGAVSWSPGECRRRVGRPQLNAARSCDAGRGHRPGYEFSNGARREHGRRVKFPESSESPCAVGSTDYLEAFIAEARAESLGKAVEAVDHEDRAIDEWSVGNLPGIAQVVCGTRR